MENSQLETALLHKSAMNEHYSFVRSGLGCVAVRHAQLGQPIQRRAAHQDLRRLPREAPGGHAITKDRLEPKHGRSRPSSADDTHSRASRPPGRSAESGADSHPAPSARPWCSHAAKSWRCAAGESWPARGGPESPHNSAVGHRPHRPTLARSPRPLASSRSGKSWLS